MSTFNFAVPTPFILPSDRIHLVIAGAGGNGAHFVHQALRVVRDHMDKGVRDYRISIFDGDVVEPKNLVRQNFYPSDIGKNKAEAVGNRYSRAFGLNIGIIPHFVEDKDTLSDLMFSSDHFPILVTCFDNHKSRLMVQELFEEKPESFVWLDLGNSEFIGQVVCGFNGQPLQEGVRTAHTFKLPSIVEVFPEIRNSDDVFKSEESCAEHAVANVQSISANVLCSTLAFGMFNQLVSQEGLFNYCIKFNAKTGASDISVNTFEKLSAVFAQ